MIGLPFYKGMVGVIDVDICVSSHLKEEPALAVDKQLQVISTIMLFKSSKSAKELKNKAVLNLKQYCMRYCLRCYVALSNVF